MEATPSINRMESFVFVASIIGFLGLVVVVGFVLFRAAFWGERDMAEQREADLSWRPPFVRGEALRRWAAQAAERLVRNRLSGKRTAKAMVEVAREVEERAVHAMLPLAPEAALERIIPCPETGQGRIGVTAPEALAIAECLRSTRSRAEQKQIRDMAVANTQKLAIREGGGGNPAILSCPLQGRDLVCCVFAARPLRCRPLHAMSVARSLDGGNVLTAGTPAEAGTPDENQYERTVEHGIERGLRRALKSARLDGNVYELNSALVRVLETPDAAERWANGENVFAGCQRLPTPASSSR